MNGAERHSGSLHTANDTEADKMNHRPKLKLNRRAQSGQSGHVAETQAVEAPELAEQLDAQTIAAELTRILDKPFSAAAVAEELDCGVDVAEVLGSYLMPRGQRFHVRRVLTSIAAYLRLDAERLRDLLGRGDDPGSGLHGDDGHHGGAGETRGPRVVVVHRRGGRSAAMSVDAAVALPPPLRSRTG